MNVTENVTENLPAPFLVQKYPDVKKWTISDDSGSVASVKTEAHARTDGRISEALRSVACRRFICADLSLRQPQPRSSQVGRSFFPNSWPRR